MSKEELRSMKKPGLPKVGKPFVARSKRAVGCPAKWTKEKTLEMAQSLREWSETDEAMILREWCTKWYRGTDLFHELFNADKRYKMKVFDKSYKYALAVVGCRRETYAMLGAVEPTIVKATMAQYDDDFKQMLIDVKRAEASARGLQYVERVVYKNAPVKKAKPKK